jgi:hypothetical protein
MIERFSACKIILSLSFVDFWRFCSKTDVLHINIDIERENHLNAFFKNFNPKVTLIVKTVLNKALKIII